MIASCRASSIDISTALDVGLGRVEAELAGQLGLGQQLALLEQRPHFLAVVQACSSGAKRASVARMLLTSRSSMARALLLPAALTACGRSMITGPSGRPARCTRTGRRGSGRCTACARPGAPGSVKYSRACSGSSSTSPRRGALWPSLVGDQFHDQHAVEVAVGCGTRTPAAASWYSASTSVFFHAVSCSLRPNLVALPIARGLAAAAHLAPFLVLHARLEAALAPCPCRPWRSGSRRRSARRRRMLPCRSSAGGSLRRSRHRRSAAAGRRGFHSGRGRGRDRALSPNAGAVRRKLAC